jgi:hypothetical protein
MINIFRSKRVIDKQIEEYCNWRVEVYPTAALREKQWILHFVKRVGRQDVAEISAEDVARWVLEIRSESRSHHNQNIAEKAIKNFLRYFHARGFPSPSPRVF